MRNRFEQQLFELNREIIEMGALCEEAIEAAAKALIDGDVIINYNLERVGYHYERNEDELFWTKEDLLRILQL